MLVCSCANPDCLVNGCLRTRGSDIKGIPYPPYPYELKVERVKMPNVGIPQGWECPKCQNIYAPAVKECEKCNGK